MGIETIIHAVTKLRVLPPERIEYSDGKRFFYQQEVVAHTESGERVEFKSFFTDAVSQRLERERLDAEHADECERMDELERRSEEQRAQIQGTER